MSSTRSVSCWARSIQYSEMMDDARHHSTSAPWLAGLLVRWHAHVGRLKEGAMCCREWKSDDVTRLAFEHHSDEGTGTVKPDASCVSLARGGEPGSVNC